jgi:putative sigma-54 modulation protein
MRIDVRGSHGGSDGGYRRWIESHVRQAFARVDRRIERIAVHLSDVHGPRGGIDKRCVVHVCLERGLETVVQERDADIRVLLDRVIGRSRRVVNRLGALRLRRSHAARPAHAWPP